MLIKDKQTPRVLKSDQTPAEIGEANQKRLKERIHERVIRERAFLYGSPKEMKGPHSPVLYKEFY